MTPEPPHYLTISVRPENLRMKRRRLARPIKPLEVDALAKLDELLDEGTKNATGELRVDLSGIDRIDSEGLNELIRTQSRLRARGVQLRLTGVGETVREVFRLTRLERVFEFEVSSEASVV
ncbi:MAG: STAS domain-containing protein [Planctomycetota bacterium]